MWDQGEGRILSHVGTVVTRTRKGSDGSTVAYLDTLRTAMRVDTLVPARLYPGKKATIYVDEDDRSKVHVNFWLLGQVTDQDSTRVQLISHTDGTILTGKDSTVLRADLRKVDYVFQLANRQTVRFPARSVVAGATTVPFKVRLARRGAPTTITADASINLYAGPTWSVVRYTHLEHSSADDNPIRVGRSFTVGPFLGLSTTDVDSTKVGLISPGLAALGSFRGVEAGLFVGIDHAVGRGSRRWDYNDGLWLGLGFGLKVLKLDPE